MDRYAEWSPIEQWADIPGYAGTYWVSSSGQVLSRPRRSSKGGMLKQAIRPGDNYCVVNLTMPSTSDQTVHLVHHLVAAAFIGERPPRLVICHNDGNGSNNWADNLRYDTQRANMRDAFFHGRTKGLSYMDFCPAGHEFTEQNSYIRRGRPGRTCRECARLGHIARRVRSGSIPRNFTVPRYPSPAL